MVQDEKDKLLELFDDEVRWCQGIDAVNQRGEAVGYDDETAVSWDLVGGLFHLFGQKRGARLCETIARHVVPSDERRRTTHYDTRSADIVAMATLLDFNDAEETTHDVLIDRLRGLPVWHGRRSNQADDASEAAGEVVGEVAGEVIGEVVSEES